MRISTRILLVGSHGWHVGARPCTEGERCLAGAVGFHLAGADCSQRGAARTCRKRACYASSRERARDGAWPCSEGEGRLTAAVGFHRAGSDSNHAARRTHAASERAAPPRMLFVGGCCRYVGARPCTEGEGRLAGTVGFHRACIDSNQRGAARTRRKCACCASCRERERARWRFFLRTCARKLLVGGRGLLPRERARAVAFFSCAHAQESCLLEAAAGTSKRGRAPRNRAVSLAQWSSIG